MSVRGEKRISPGVPIYEGKYWHLEHAYPSKLKGWLVLVLERHAEALHDLTPEEFAELGVLQERTIRFFHDTLHTEKEYLACFAEADGFSHIHIHIVPRTDALPEEFRGSKSFAMLKVNASEAVPPEEIALWCEEMKARFMAA